MSASGDIGASPAWKPRHAQFGELSSRYLLILWPLATCIPVIDSPRVTLFDLLCVFITLSRPKRTLQDTLATNAFYYLVILYNGIYFVSALATHASIGQTIWRVGAFDLLIIDVLAVCTALRSATLAQANTFFFYYSIGICLQILDPENGPVTYIAPIKFVLNIPLAVVLVSLVYPLPISRALRTFCSAVVLTAYVAISALTGARNAAGVEFIPVVAYFVPPIKFFRHVNIKTYVLGIAGAVAATYALINLYYYLATAGILGLRAKAIAEFQGRIFGGGVGLLMGGRPEIVMLLLGTAAAPWLGHGVGNDLLPYEETLIAARIWGKDYIDNGMTIIHSVIFGASFEAGVLTMLLWLYLMHLCLRAIMHIFGYRPPGFEVPLLYLAFAFWNVLFSPLVGITRLWLVAALFYAFYFRRTMLQATAAPN